MSSWNAHLTSERVGSEIAELSVLSRQALAMNAAAPAPLVNRTHRVVRHRATTMRARRSYVRSLLLPMALCSVALTLATFAVWSGMYQSTDAAEAIQDVASRASTDTTNHLLVTMLWFVPLTLILLVAIWMRHVRSRESDATR